MIKYTCILLYIEKEKEWKYKPRPSLGDWVSRFQKMTTETFGLKEEDRSRVAKVYSILNTLQINERVQDIVQYRNDNLGHGHLIGHDYNFNHEAEVLGSAIQKMEDLLLPIWEQRELFHPNGGLEARAGSLSIQGYKLNGNLTIFPIEEELIPIADMPNIFPLLEKIQEGNEQYRIIMFNENHKAFNMHEHIRYRTCNVCNQRRLTMKDGEFWLDVVQGHRIRRQS